uniref:Essential protein Yae1 N-terminal domain-containing protein n=1 Tax=Nyssomyia neivai TaxID=330878 RepID=A0A1L8DC89_9DIPT
MTHSGSQEDEFQVSARDFNKLTDIHHKSGYKDGVSDGREQKYQEGFDAGFRDGFQHAFLVGKYKALAWADDQRKGNEATGSNNDLLLKNPQLGHCQICLDESLLEKNLTELEKLNNVHTQKVHERVKEKYGELSPDKGSLFDDK